MASPQLQLLSSILNERDLSFDRDQLAHAIELPKIAVEAEAWTKKYLSPHNLLTKEQYHFATRRDQAARQGTSCDPLSDEAFEDAISLLESGTDAIGRQCRLLQSQKDAFLNFPRRRAPDGEGKALHDRQQKVARERARVDVDLEELNSSVLGHLRTSATNADTAITSLPNNIKRAFEKDDRVLDGLQKIVSRFDGSNQDQTPLEEVERLCRAFTVLQASAIRLRVDRAYQSALANAAPRVNGRSTSLGSGEQRAIRAELHELSGEITSLLSLVAENHHRAPIATSLRQARDDAEAESAKWSEYTACVLLYLTARLEVLDEHFKHVCAYQCALGALGNELDTMLAPAKDAGGFQTVLQSKPMSPHKGLKPLRLVQANFSEMAEPTVQLLRLLDIKDAIHSGDVKQRKSLQSVTGARRSKLAELEMTTEQTLASQMARSMRKCEEDAWSLQGAVYADSKFGSIELVEETLQAHVDVLEERTQLLSKKLRSLDLERLSRQMESDQYKLLGQNKR